MGEKVSVAIATYNGERYLKEQIDSILNQSISPYEIIICDDKSNDNTVDILREYAKYDNFHFYINTEQLGVIKNFEKVISLCSGDYIALSDQDDVWDSKKLFCELNEMHRLEKKYGKIPLLVFSDLELVNSNLDLIADSFWKTFNIDPSKISFKKLLFGNSITGCTILINKELKSKIKYLPTEACMHDHWLALIASSLGQIGYVSKRLVKYRQHEYNVTTNDPESFIKRIKSFWSKVVNRRLRNQYLSKQIQQADKFYCMYSDELNEKRKDTILSFINLKNRNFLYKKISI